jgi:hypothetical protein
LRTIASELNGRRDFGTAPRCMVGRPSAGCDCESVNDGINAHCMNPGTAIKKLAAIKAR